MSDVIYFKGVLTAGTTGSALIRFIYTNLHTTPLSAALCTRFLLKIQENKPISLDNQ